MKKMILSLILVLSISAVSFSRVVLAEGKTYSALGDYKIEAADNPIQILGEDCKAYVIKYENTPMEVTVIVCKDKKCKKFIVLSDKLSVQYVCHPEYFGVERLDKSMEKEGYKTEDSALNRVEYFHQKVICPGTIPVLDATRTIAAFFPFLLNNEDKMVATN